MEVNNKAEVARIRLLIGLVISIAICIVVDYKLWKSDIGGIGEMLTLLVSLFGLYVLYWVIKWFQRNLDELFMKYGAEVFKDIKFDVENGVDREGLEESENFSGFNERESNNAIIGKRYLISEEVLYSVLKKKERLKAAVFEGVILEIDGVKKDISAKMFKDGGKETYYGKNIDEKIRKKIAELMKILGVSDCIAETVGEKLYVGFAGGKMFYQYNIFKKIDINKNVSRVKLLDEAAEMLVEEVLL